ncbi:hypothetical protein Bbelb_065800 [Branchiostoma belcheri]|nr:hypothetical protein Bbelb_065800 [Branchiostoma belcheri]
MEQGNRQTHRPLPPLPAGACIRSNPYYGTSNRRQGTASYEEVNLRNLLPPSQRSEMGTNLHINDAAETSTGATYHSEEDLVARLGSYNTPHVYYRSTVHRQQVVPDARVKLDCHKVSVVTPASLVLSLAPNIRECNHPYCSSKRAEENLKGNGENVRNDDTYTTRHKRCRSPALNEQVSTRNVRKTSTTSSITSRTTTCPMSHHTCHLACYCSASQCSQTTTLRTSCTRDSDTPHARRKDHNVTLTAHCSHRSVPKNTSERTVTTQHDDEKITPPAIVPKNTSERTVTTQHDDEKITPPAMCAYRSLLPPKCTKEHLRENSDDTT